MDVVNAVAYRMRLTSSSQRCKHQTALFSIKLLDEYAELRQAAVIQRSKSIGDDKVVNLGHEFEWNDSFSPPSARLVVWIDRSHRQTWVPIPPPET